MRKLILWICVLCLGVGLAWRSSAQTVEGVDLPILMYHNITEKKSQVSRYCILAADFESDLKFLQAQGYQTVTMTQVINYVLYDGTLPEKPVVLTFDDGYESVLAVAGPILEKYSMTAVVCAIGTAADIFTATEDHNLDYSHLSWVQLQEMAKGETFEIQNHSYNMHKTKGPRRGAMRARGESRETYRASLYADAFGLQKKIFEQTGYLPNTYAYPFGAMDTDSDQVLQEVGFSATLSCTEKINHLIPGTDCLTRLGRYNRSGLESSQKFFRRTFPK